MKKLLLLLAFIIPPAIYAQDYYVPDGYIGYYDYDHRVVVRRNQWANEDYQDLWNGCYVRVNGSYKYIYRNGNRILYGTNIALTHNGNYLVSFDSGNTYHLYDSDGSRTSAWGYDFSVNWDGTVSFENSGLWRLYDPSGNYTGVYGHDICMFWDGTYVVLFNGTWRVYDADYNRTSVYGDDIWIMSSGQYKCQRGSYTAVYNIDGTRAY